MSSCQRCDVEHGHGSSPNVGLGIRREQSTVGFLETRGFAFVPDLADDRRDHRGVRRLAAGRCPIALRRHLLDDVLCPKRLLRFGQDLRSRVQARSVSFLPWPSWRGWRLPCHCVSGRASSRPWCWSSSRFSWSPCSHLLWVRGNESNYRTPCTHESVKDAREFSDVLADNGNQAGSGRRSGDR